MDGKVIVWKQAGYQPDWYARERREEARFRASERRAWITYIVENLVMVAVAACTMVSVGIALTML